ncbi:alanine racemase [Tessaracoccus aquimaris]|uniref:Alanine racemase n=1 Tax=Tessaracoccus aquimaris TaxID=1332264 RepID=A0A1Q2CRN3_9ACTN|nr:alanine racemase [Tessaracoccus aquimaris]AQP48764.1 alanine racemase [Tessaracoccus aquimaris]
MLTRFHVDLDALHHNLQVARELSGGRQVLAPVKANAYGHGLVPVARSIQERRSAEWLGIAIVAEGQQLRAAGITLPMLKFSPTLPEELAAAIAADITLSVGDLASIDQAQAAAAAAGRMIDVHLKVDTGMRRVGAEPDEAAALARRIDAAPNLRLEGIFTHLPISDIDEGDDFTTAQLQRFHATVDAVEAEHGPVDLVHAANSGAVLGHDLGRSNLVRPGIMLYGSYPDVVGARPADLRDVGRWTSRVNFIKPILAGETVGYGRSWVAQRDTWIATVAVGYGDGYSRQFSSRGRMLIDGRSYPVAGRVCMDQTMIDLGPEPTGVRVGDEVVLMGSSGDQRIGVEELATVMGTITYEVTCLITERVPRLY